MSTTGLYTPTLRMGNVLKLTALWARCTPAPSSTQWNTYTAEHRQRYPSAVAMAMRHGCHGNASWRFGSSYNKNWNHWASDGDQPSCHCSTLH